MPAVVTHTVSRSHREAGLSDLVLCGSAHAVWRVLGREVTPESVIYTLEPVDAHDVPLGMGLFELPIR